MKVFEEAIRCRDDICYFIQKYIVDFKLDEHQIAHLKNLASGNDSIYEAVDDVQELNLAFALWKMLVCPYTSVVFMSNGKSRNQLANRFRRTDARNLTSL